MFAHIASKLPHYIKLLSTETAITIGATTWGIAYLIVGYIH